MPITTFLPSGVFGPGVVVGVQTDLIGPIGIGWTWQLICFPDFDPEANAIVCTKTSNQLHVDQIRAEWPNLIAPEISIKTQEPCHYIVYLLDDRGVVQDQSERLPVVYDPTAELWRYLDSRPTAGGGLTGEEHAWLDTTQAAVQQIFQTASGLIQATPIGSVLSHPPLALMNVFGNCESLTGRGTLIPPGQFTSALLYGIVITFEIVPPGFGKRNGAADEYVERICQFVTVHSTNDAAYGFFDEIKDVYANNTLWLWTQFAPKQILFDVTPGCQVQVCWLGI